MKRKPDYTVRNGFTRRRRSFTETVARIGVVLMVLGLFVGLFIYGAARCTEAVERWNDIKTEGGWKE